MKITDSFSGIPESRKTLRAWLARAALVAVAASMAVTGEAAVRRRAKGAAAETKTAAPETVVTNAFGMYIPPESLQRPYISFNGVKSVVSPDERVSVSVFVTDWNNSLLRLGDDSHRFSVSFIFRPMAFEGKEKVVKPKSLQEVKAGDYSFTFPKLREGEWQIGAFCTDGKGRRSHTVWHEIASRDPERYAAEIAAATKVLTKEELEAAGVTSEPEGLYRIIKVPVSLAGIPDKERHAVLTNAVAEAVAKGAEPPEGGYDIYAPADTNGLIHSRGAQTARVVRSPSRDEPAVRAEAMLRTERLQKVIDDAASNGVRRLVLAKGIYRLHHEKTIMIPSGMILDMNGATFKLNGFAGHSSCIVSLQHTHDSALVNGTLEGDYFEHDYAGSTKNSEWVVGFNVGGDARRTKVENMTFRNITGYGGGCGITGGSGITWPGTAFGAESDYEPGALDIATGELGKGAPSQFTSPYYKLDKYVNGYITFSRYLGYQGRAARAWSYLICFYDADKNFLGGDVAYQYRHVPVPKGAAFARITKECVSLEDTKKSGMTGVLFRRPWNCEIVSNRFEMCRCVGFAMAAALNMRFEGNEFTRSGEASACCAFDAEDGWDMMQDAWIKGNRFHHNPRNELLFCAGHDFLVEENDCDVYIWDRTQSTLFRNNRFRSASFGAGIHDRTMHQRFAGNTFMKTLNFGKGEPKDGWTVAMSGYELATPDDNPENKSLIVGRGGILRDSSLTRVNVTGGGTLARCRLDRCRFISPPSGRHSEDVFKDCFFQHIKQTNLFEKCVFDGSCFGFVNGCELTFEGCEFKNTRLDPCYWSVPGKVTFRNCSIDVTNSLFRTPIYSIGELTFENCRIDVGKAGLVEIYDLRPQKTDDRKAVVTFKGCEVLAAGVPLVTVPATGPSTKTMDIVVENCKFAHGAHPVDPEILKYRDKDGKKRDWTLDTRRANARKQKGKSK